MNKKISYLLSLYLSIFSFSFLLNYVWESNHAVFLYAAHDFGAEEYVRMVIYASAVDGGLILVIYILTAILWRDILWPARMHRRHAYAVFALGLIFAFVVEYRKVYLLREWSYSSLMPTVFGIGLSPLLQLGLTGLTTFWLTRRMFYSIEWRNQ